ncbi:unnamed protein product, partial [marine sediment metagenome]
MEIIYIIIFGFLLFIFTYDSRKKEGFSLKDRYPQSSIVAFGLLIGLVIGYSINGKYGAELGAIIGGLTMGFLNYFYTSINSLPEVESFRDKSNKKKGNKKKLREDRKEKKRLDKLKRQDDFKKEFENKINASQKQIMNPRIDNEKIINDLAL